MSVPKNSGALLIGLPELHLDIAELNMSGLQWSYPTITLSGKHSKWWHHLLRCVP